MNKNIILFGLLFIPLLVNSQTPCFQEQNGMVAIEAEHYTSKKGGWEEVEGRNARTPDITGTGVERSTQVAVGESHIILKGLNMLTIGEEGYSVPFAYPHASGKIVASVKNDPEKAVVFVYEKGASLSEFNAPEKRVVVFTANSRLTKTGWDLLVNTIKWAAGDGNKILFISSRSIPVGTDEIWVNKLKESGLVVDVGVDKEVKPEDAKGYHAVVISESVGGDAVGDKFKAVQVPVVVSEPHIYNMMGLTKTKEPWQPKTGESGNAMMIRQGKWDDHLQYAIYFNTPGDYHLWMLGKDGGDGGADEVKVFFNTKEIKSDHPNFFEIKFPKEMGWTNIMHYKTPENRKTKGQPILKVPAKGWYSLALVKGSEPELHDGEVPESRRYPNWRIDKIVLSKSENTPSGDGPAETLCKDKKLPENMIANQPWLPKQVFKETDKYVVIEAEDIDHHPDWEMNTSPNGYSGKGYLIWKGADRTRSVEGAGGNDDYLHVRQGPQEEYLIIRVMITNPGIYRLDVRNIHQREDGDNDSWVAKLGVKATDEKPIQRLGDSHKDGNGFTWLDWGVRPFELKKGLNELYIGGRSIGFGIDKIALYLETDEAAKAKALDVKTPVSLLVK